MRNFKFTTREKVYLLIALLVLIMLFISSSMTYQQQEMKPGFINTHLHFIEEIVGNGGTAGMTQFVVRKMAHFGSYFLVGMFGFLGLRRIFKLKWVAPVLTWFGAIALAAFDEYHQYLTGDRTPSVHDVMLDASGALCGIVLGIIVIFIRKKLQKK